MGTIERAKEDLSILGCYYHLAKEYCVGKGCGRFIQKIHYIENGNYCIDCIHKARRGEAEVKLDVPYLLRVYQIAVLTKLHED